MGVARYLQQGIWIGWRKAHAEKCENIWKCQIFVVSLHSQTIREKDYEKDSLYGQICFPRAL